MELEACARALADLTFLEHVLGSDTLHPQVYRVLAESILHFKDGALKISSLLGGTTSTDAIEPRHRIGSAQ